MPRVNIHVHDIDEIEELEEQEDWELQLGLAPADPRREINGGDGRNGGGRDRARGERRFGGNEALDRKRADRRKSYARAGRRIS